MNAATPADEATDVEITDADRLEVLLALDELLDLGLAAERGEPRR